MTLSLFNTIFTILLTKKIFCYTIFLASGCSSVWYERYVGDVEAAGSSPVTPTIYNGHNIGLPLKREALHIFLHFAFAAIMLQLEYIILFFTSLDSLKIFQHLNQVLSCK